MSVSFADLGVPANLVERLRERGITEAFPIQEAALPDALAGRDVVGKAVTGSGKTLAFGLPLMARITKAGPASPWASCWVPTREIAAQVQKELANLTDDRAGASSASTAARRTAVARKALELRGRRRRCLSGPTRGHARTGRPRPLLGRYGHRRRGRSYGRHGLLPLRASHRLARLREPSRHALLGDHGS